jgi:hypothetical protein
VNQYVSLLQNSVYNLIVYVDSSGRDPKYISLVMDFVQGVPKAGMLINVFSYFLRPYVLLPVF